LKSRQFLGALLVALCFGPALGAAAAPLRVAVLPVVVHSASGDTEYLSAGLAEMLSARLEQAGGIEVVSLDGDARATTKLKVALEAARSVDAQFVVFGSFTQFGDGASLDLRAAMVDEAGSDDAPEARAIFVQSGTLGAIIPRLDDVAGRVVQFLRGNGGVAPPPPVAAAPKQAPEAPAAAAGGDLERRVEALERAVFPPPSEAADAEAAGAE
jgi:TolB-like protein